MKIEFWAIGKTAFSYLDEGIGIYEKRLIRYLPFKTVIIPDAKNANKLPPDKLKIKEAESVLSKLDKTDFLVLLDERGKSISSVQFAKFIENKMVIGQKKLVFLVGGAWGFADEMYQRANYQLSLSKMTFSHQMIRLFFVEQLFRAMTILKGEPYHNE